MGHISTKFLDKDYTIPEDVLVYIDLVDFTNNIKDSLVLEFKRKTASKIDDIEEANFMIEALHKQAFKFINKLLENGIFNRTVDDYITNSKGIELFLETKQKIVRQIIDIRQEKYDTYKAGYENALYKKESSVTGLDFGIISSSFVNHMIYASMNASEEVKQEKAALEVYKKEIAELKKVVQTFDSQEKAYIEGTVNPAMDAVFTYYAYDLLEKYISDLSQNGKFDKAALSFSNIERSNALLKNLEMTSNKAAVLSEAFVACPFNIAVYMNAMKHDLLDYDSFQTAKVFKQDHHVLSFFRESWGEVSFPTKFNINYHCISVWASLTGKSSADLLRGLTEQYATGIVKAYSRVADIMADKSTCRKIIGELREDTILSGDSICDGKAREYVEPIVHAATWEQLTERCGHTDLLSRIRKSFPSVEELPSKKDFDRSATKQLAARFEEVRKELAEQIEARRAEEERQRIELERQKAEQARIQAEKKAKRTAVVKKGVKRTLIVIGGIVAVCIALVIAGIIYLFATDKPIDDDFSQSYEDSLHSLTYYVPENWEYSAVESSDNESWYARYDNWGNFLGAMVVSYEGESPDVTVASVVAEFKNECSEAKSVTEIIDGQEFNVITFELESADATPFFYNIYVTEEDYSVFYISFIFVEENNKTDIFDKIVGSIVFEDYANPKEAAYNEGIGLMSAGKYADALLVFTELNGYKDSADKIIECENAILETKYNEASCLMADGKYKDAYDILKSLGDFKNSNNLMEECLSAVFDENIAQLIAAEKYGEAYGLLVSSGNQEQLKYFKAVYTISSYSDKYYDSNSVYTYDELGNLLRDVETYEDGDKKIKEYTYDSNNRLITERITESDSPSDYFETTYEYNAHGQKIKEVTTYDYGNGNAGSYTYEYEYDPNGNMVTSIYSKAGESGEKITKYEYNSNGQITKELYHDGTYYYFEYGSNNELLKKVYVWSDGHESYDSYLYDDNGVLVKEMDYYGNSIEYFYDSNYCLIKLVEYDENQIDSVTEYGEYIVFYLFND